MPIEVTVRLNNPSLINPTVASSKCVLDLLTLEHGRICSFN